MAATRASKASARMDSRRCPPLFSSPGPRRRWSPSDSPRASSARASRRTRRARRRVSWPSLALGKRSYSSSATMAPTRPSPRNSRRSLCGMPALRWLSAWRSRPGSANRYSRPGMTSAAKVLGAVKAGHEIDVAEQVPAHLVLHLDARCARRDDRDIVGLHRFHVAGVQALVEALADGLRAEAADALLLGQTLHGRDHAVVLGI